jgi:hypothetical protein
MKSKSYIILILFFIISLIPLVIGNPISILLITISIIWLLFLILLIYKKDSTWKTHLLLSPVVVFAVITFLNSTYNYLTGSATLYFNNNNSIYYFSNKDFNFKYRLYYHNYDGEHYGNLTFNSYCTYYRYIINDTLLKGMVNLFGFQPKMYKGRFPVEKILYNDFKTEKIEKIIIDDANIGYAKFKYRNKTIELYAKKKWDSSVKGEGGYDILEDILIPIDSTTFRFDGKKLRKDSYILIMAKYYPLIFNVYNRNGDNYEYQIIDAENQKIISNHYFN